MEKYLNSSTLIYILALCWAVNQIITTILNARKAGEQAKEPFVKLETNMSDMRSRIEALERRVTTHDDDLADLHAGQSALCRGVQALLEHELHNGNDEEMRAASDSIGKWLRTR